MQEAGKAGSARHRVSLCFTSNEIADLLAFALDRFFDCELKSFAGAKELVASLQNAKPNLLVIDGARDDANVLLEAAAALKIKTVVHHAKKQAPTVEGVDLAGVFNEPELLPGITTVLKQLGAVVRNPSESASNPTYPYFRVGVPLLLRTNPLVADIYVKLSELKYLKLFHKGAPFAADDVAKYHGTKKIEYFYVKVDEADSITAKLNEALELLLREVPLPAAVSTPVSLATIDTVHSLVNQVGFTPEVQRLVKNNVDLVLKEMYASPSLGSILKNLDLDREKYIASHSHMLAEVACALSIAMRWDSDTTFKKLTMAALLHDMGLSNQKLARVKDLTELKDRHSEFGPSDAEDYRSHSRRAGVLVKGIKEVPADVDKIILQHHEMPMGTGFPEGL
ncbi:MAG: HD domain-containing phosphohydrolase, partial [Bdellovibrionota bacterium]